MGNRGVVCFADRSEIEKYLVDGAEKLEGFCAANGDKVGVYLHWNGGRDSIVNFCEVCRRKNFRDPVNDCYGVARFIQTVTNFLGVRSGLSVGVDTLNHLDCDNWDNGVFIVDGGWNIIGREFKPEYCSDEAEATLDEDFIEDLMDRFPAE